MLESKQILIIRYFLILLLIDVFFLCIPIISLAEPDDTESSIDLGTIYVEDETASLEVEDHPASFSTVLDPSELIKMNITLSEALDSQPGINISSFGGLGQLSTITIRSPGSKNVLVLLDGVPLNPTGEVVDLSDISLTSLERIEIIRGGNSSYYGGGAVGGVIKLTSISSSIDKKASNRFRLSAGSFDTGIASYTNSDSILTFHAEFTGSSGQYPFYNNNGTYHNAKDDFHDIRHNNEYSSMNLRTRKNIQITDNELLSLSLEYFEALKGIPGIITFPSFKTSQSDKRIFFHTRYYNNATLNGNAEISLSFLRQSLYFTDPFGESSGVPLNTSIVNDRFDLRGIWEGTGFSNADILSVGAMYSDENISSTEVKSENRLLFSLWASDEYYYNSGSIISTGIRFDSVDGDSVFSPAIRASLPLDENVLLKTNFGLDYTPPSFEELYRNEGFIIGNPDLKPERTLSFDLGIDYFLDNLKFECVYFNNQTKNLINYLLISGFRWKPYNSGRIRSSGLELSLDWMLTDKINIVANYTRTTAVDTSTNPISKGNLIPGLPLSDIYSEMSYKEKDYELSLNYQRTGSTPINSSGSLLLPSHNSFGAVISIFLSEFSAITFEIDNVFDKTRSDVRGFPLPGRTISLTYLTEW